MGKKTSKYRWITPEEKLLNPRSMFVDAINVVAHEVVVELHSQVFEKYKRLYTSTRAPSLDRIDRELHKALIEWAEPYNLTSKWFLEDCALRTLGIWKRNSHLKEYRLYNRMVGGFFKPVIPVEDVTISCKWIYFLEARDTAKDRYTKQFEEQLKQYLDRVECVAKKEGFMPDMLASNDKHVENPQHDYIHWPDIEMGALSSLRRYVWLVHDLVHGWSVVQIAKHYNDMSRKCYKPEKPPKGLLLKTGTVEKGLREVAKAIGFKVSTRRSR